MAISKHWAEQYAQRVIETHEKTSTQNTITCASGITPSGFVHIGNFREIMSVDLVYRCIKIQHKNCRFIFSWDDFDVFRKIPDFIENKAKFEPYLRHPITEIPSHDKHHQNYAQSFEKKLETELKRVGISPMYLYQSQKYKNGDYAHEIRTCLKHRATIKEILNQQRTTKLPEKWWPVSIFSKFTRTDNTEVLSWDGEWTLTYLCKDTNQKELCDLRNTDCIKLLWRIDWPMRWAYEKVSFEPAGKDHHSKGGSFDTGKSISSQIFDYKAPVSFKYDFVRIKGGKGKMSASEGELITLEEALSVYQAEVLRYIFASTRPNIEFAISFDLDVIKVYEDYDKCERIAHGLEDVSQERKQKEISNYTLSQISEHYTLSSNQDQLLQFSFRHIANILQIYNFDKALCLERLLKDSVHENDVVSKNTKDMTDKLERRIICCEQWIKNYAPQDFIFRLRDAPVSIHSYAPKLVHAIDSFAHRLVDEWHNFDDEGVHNLIYETCSLYEQKPQEFFSAMYYLLIGKEKGPKLAKFLMIIGKETFCFLMKPSLVNNNIMEDT